MSYAKDQEDRMEEHFKRAGFDLIEDTARRKKFHADRIMEHKSTGLTLAIDHKSTRNKEGFRLTREMLDKVKEEAGNDKIGVITISFLSCPKLYAVVEVEDLGTIMDW